MVRRQTTKVTRPTARKVRPRRVAKAGVRRTAKVESDAMPGCAAQRLELASRAAAKLARSSMREMAAAAKAAGPPMQLIWRAVASAGRNIARDATVAWYELAPAVYPTASKVGRRPAA